MEKEKKLKIVIGVLVVLLIVAVGVIIALTCCKDKDKAKDTTTVNEKKKDDEKKPEEKPEEEPEENPEEEEEEPEREEQEFKVNKNYKVKKVLFETDKRDEDSYSIIKLTTDNSIVVTYTKRADDEGWETTRVSDLEVVKDVKSTYLVHAGMSDICWGNENLIIVTKTKTLRISIDELTCGNTLYVEELEGLEGITKVEEKSTKTNDLEPLKYTVYATTKDGKKIDITSRLE